MTINQLYGQSKILLNEPAEDLKSPYPDFQVDKPYSWSPKGTYMIAIKSDKIEFIGGDNMSPVLTINQPKVESCVFSPCEKYLLVYQPKNKESYSVYDFQRHEILRQFEQEEGEDGNTYQWSYDGKYIAKILKKEIKTV